MKQKPFEQPGTTGFYQSDGTWQVTGSMMGRRNVLPEDCNTPRRLYMQRVPFADGCYDPGGAYWGGPADLYCAWDDETEIWVRAGDRAQAKAAVREQLPTALFYR